VETSANYVIRDLKKDESFEETAAATSDLKFAHDINVDFDAAGEHREVRNSIGGEIGHLQQKELVQRLLRHQKRRRCGGSTQG